MADSDIVEKETLFVNLDGFVSEVILYNPGNKKVLLGFHGFGGSASSFRRIVKWLPADVSLYSVSLPWHGKTEDPEDKLLDPESYSEAVSKWISTLECDKVSLIAHSFGARLCSVLAAQHPALIEQIFYLAPGGFYKWEDAMFRVIEIQPIRYLSKFDVFIRPYARFLIPGLKPSQEAKVLHALRKIGYSFPKVSIRKTGIINELNVFDGPFWLILGKKDRLLPYSESEKILSYWKNGHLLGIDNCGHLPMAEKPEITGKFIAEKLSG